MYRIMLVNISGNASLEYLCLGLNQDCLLAAFSGVPEFQLTLFDWIKEEQIASVDTDIKRVNRIVINFGPDIGFGGSKVFSLETDESLLSVWKVKSCGNVRSISQEPLSSHKGHKGTRIKGAWKPKESSMIIMKMGSKELERVWNLVDLRHIDSRQLFQIYEENFEKKSVREWRPEDQLCKATDKIVDCFCFESDMLMLFCPRLIFITKLSGSLAFIVKQVNLEVSLGSVRRFQSGCEIIGSTIEGSMIKFVPLDSYRACQILFNCGSHTKKNFLDLALINPEGALLAALEQNRIYFYDLMCNEVVSSTDLSHEAVFLIAHNRHPLIMVGSSDGTLTGIGLTYKVISKSDENEERIKVDVKFLFDITVHTSALKFVVMEEVLGLNMVISSDDKKLFIVNTAMKEKKTKYPEMRSLIHLESSPVDAAFVGQTIVCLLNDDSKSKVGNQICCINFDGQTMRITNVLKMNEACSGIALTFNASRFTTFLVKKKTLVEYDIHVQANKNGKGLLPLHQRKTHHQLKLSRIQRTPLGLATLGCDGDISFVPEPLSKVGTSSVARLFHFQSGGVRCLVVNADPLRLMALDWQGSLQIMQTRDDDSLDMPKSRKRPKRLEDVFRSIMAEEQVFVQKEAWSTWFEKDLIIQERKTHDGELSDIENELTAIQNRVDHLVELNNQLPAEDRIEGSEFELNTEEKERLIQEGFEKETSLRLELKAMNKARERIAEDIKREVWDDMEVKGKAIKGIWQDVLVRNYPLPPQSKEETENLERALKERRLTMEIEKIADRSNNDSNYDQQLSASHSPMVSPSQSALGSKQGSVGGQKSPSSMDLMNETELAFAGSLSDKFIDIKSCLLMEPLSLNTKMQISQQIILLKNVVRLLKQNFNVRFDRLFDEKNKVLKKIQSCVKKLDQIRTEQETKNFSVENFVWTSEENPELDLPPLSMRSSQLLPDDDSRLITKEGSMRFVSRDVAMEVPQPEFMEDGIRSSVTFTPAEVSAVEEYRDQLKRQDRIVMSDVRVELNDQISLERRILETAKDFDHKLLELYRVKIEFEKCVLSEELKILLYDKSLARTDQLDKEEHKRVQTLKSLVLAKERADEALERGQEALIKAKETLLILNEKDKMLEKNFKKEFPELNYNQIEALLKSYKLRPTVSPDVEMSMKMIARQNAKKKTAKGAPEIQDQSKKQQRDLKSKSIASTLERMSNMFLGTSSFTQTSDAKVDSKATPKSKITLDELDSPEKCPEIVSLDDWNTHCRLRRDKIECEKKIGAAMMELAETEEAVMEREETAQVIGLELKETKASLDEWRKQKNLELNNVEVVLNLPRGQIEVPTNETSPHLEGAVLLTDSVIEKLNQEIGKLGESKLSAMEEMKDIRTSARLLEWEKEKLCLEMEDLHGKWAEIQHTKITKETRKVLLTGRPPLTEEYEALDKVATVKQEYLMKKREELDNVIQDLKSMRESKEEENLILATDLQEIEQEVQLEKDELEAKEKQLKALNEPDRMARAMKRSKLLQKIKEQYEVIKEMQDKLDVYMFKSFPSLG